MLRSWPRRRRTRELECPGRGQAVLRIPRYVVAVAALPFLLFAVYDVHAQLPPNVLELPGEHEVAPSLRKLAPQGWAFFTKSPRSGVVVPYARSSSGAWVSKNMGPHSAAHNLLGVDRKSRAQGVEVALLLKDVDKDEWQDCAGDVDACIAAHPANDPVPVENVSPEPTVCGRVVLVEETAVPWSYRDLVPYGTRAQNIVGMEVSC